MGSRVTFHELHFTLHDLRRQAMTEQLEKQAAVSEGTKLLGLRTAMYHVGDMAAAKAWYSQVLGFGPYFDQPEYYIGFNVEGYELGLHPDLPDLTKGDSAYAY